jgi:hypothetical protein
VDRRRSHDRRMRRGGVLRLPVKSDKSRKRGPTPPSLDRYGEIQLHPPSRRRRRMRRRANLCSMCARSSGARVEGRIDGAPVGPSVTWFNRSRAPRDKPRSESTGNSLQRVPTSASSTFRNPA